MIIKYAHQINMIDKILLLEMKLKKKIMNNDKNFSEIKENNYIINEKKKLIKSYHFNYQETAQTVIKKTIMKKAREITRETDQRRFRVSEQRSARISDNKIQKHYYFLLLLLY